jgi:alkanesulfonate monooxygenase SsuD/methylene tetrahydromethanopterin reductase-like flavin-dependent oxidoreductase (luciferase family)
MPVKVGIFVVPDASEGNTTLEQIEAADASGLDVVGVQDHPYQRRFHDTWTLLAYVAARTSRVSLVPDVVNLPLRQPTVLAKSAASLDALTGGRVEIGIGAGAFWEAIEAMGGPTRSPGESVDALEEAMTIMRAWWSGDRSVNVDGSHYRVRGAKPGPPPAHPIGLWVGAYGPRMQRLTGRLGDGWLPSLGGHYLSPEDVAPMQERIDEAARRAERDPASIVRAVNVMAPDGADLVSHLASVASELRFSVLMVGVPEDDPVGFVRRLGEEVAPGVRERVG